MPLGTRSHAKAVPEARSFSAPFFSGFGAISARLLGGKMGQKVVFETRPTKRHKKGCRLVLGP